MPAKKRANRHVQVVRLGTAPGFVFAFVYNLEETDSTGISGVPKERLAETQRAVHCAEGTS
jgi:hypothetical protein